MCSYDKYTPLVFEAILTVVYKMILSNKFILITMKTLKNEKTKNFKGLGIL